MADEIALRGGCLCGAVRYTLAAPPLAVAACHCSRCRRQSGSAYSVNLIVRAQALQIEGELASFEDRETDSGAPLSRDHCARCGSPIRSVPSAAPKLVALKAGTLDDPSSFPPRMHIWTSSKLPWVEVPAGMVQFERGPQA